MDWQQRHADRICTAEAAVRAIRPGRRVLIGSGAAEPARLVNAMVAARTGLADNEIVHLMTRGPAPYVTPGMEQHFRHTAFFIGDNVREAVHQGRADFMPVFLSEIPALIRSRRIRIDVAMIQVSTPDEDGQVSLGVSVDVVRAAVDRAEVVLAEVNERMPRTRGDCLLPVDRILHMVAVDDPLPEYRPAPHDEVTRAIGEHVASLIPDGATLQAGIGRIPHAALDALGERNDLGVHTEMMSDGIMRLVRRGVITGRRKTLLPGKHVSSFVLGTGRLYDWVHDNPAIEMRPSEFTNDPFLIARNDRMISINSALAVDLTGQVAADTLLGRFFSGIGGQVDFIRGAARSREGKPIIALPSTARGGSVSRIRPALEAGAGVVTSRGDVHYVVTEFGVADLWGKNIRQRAMALIEIAHPDYRAELLDSAKRRRYVFPDQIVPRAAYPWRDARAEKLADGQEVIVRPVRISDEGELQDLFYRLSDESTYRRFMAFKRTHPHEEMQRLVDLDYEHAVALVACLPGEGESEILAMCRYDVDPATRLADIAFVVRDEWQGRGLGKLLLRRMAEIARGGGLKGFLADVLIGNRPMLAVFRGGGFDLEMESDGASYHLEMRFPGVGGRTGPPV